MPATFTEKLIDRPGEKNRFYRWTPVTDGSNEYSPAAGELVLTSSRDHQVYRVEESPADGFGRAFTLFKADGTGFYSLFCSAGVDDPDECDCRGFQAHRSCKHLESLRDLISNRQL